MKKYLLIICLFITFCSNQNRHNDKTQTILQKDAVINKKDKTKPLIIGGKQYSGYILDYSTPKTFTLADIDNIDFIFLDIDPMNPSKINSLDGIELLIEAKNLKTIRIAGKNLDRIDLSPLEKFQNIIELDIYLSGNKIILPDLTSFKSIRNLGIYIMKSNDLFTLKLPSDLKEFTLSGENLQKINLSAIEALKDLTVLRIKGDITELPNITKLEKLHNITIENAKLENLKGIGATNVKSIEISSIGKGIDSFSPLNNLSNLESLTINSRSSNTLKISDMSNLPNLKNLRLLLFRTKIDLSGIEKLSALDKLEVGYPEPFNIEGIGKLRNLQHLYLNLISPEPSVEFLKNMPNLNKIFLDADGTRRLFPHETEPYQVLDVSPLASIKKLQNLTCRVFIIKNIASLDVLETLSIRSNESQGYINLVGSKLYNETDKSRHKLVLEHPVKE